jgi:hypothetical protein
MPSFPIKAIAASLRSVGHVSSVTHRAFRRPRSCRPCSPRHFLRASAPTGSNPSSSGTSRVTNNWSLLDFSEEFRLVDLHRMGSEIRYGNAYFPIFRRLTEDTGDILSVKILGQVIVILNSPKTAKDLLEKRGNIYSDRHLMPFYQMYASYPLFSDALMVLIIKSGWDGNGFTRLLRIVTTGVRGVSSWMVVSAQVPWFSTVRCSLRKHTTSSTNSSLIPDPSITRSNCS